MHATSLLRAAALIAAALFIAGCATTIRTRPVNPPSTSSEPPRPSGAPADGPAVVPDLPPTDVSINLDGASYTRDPRPGIMVPCGGGRRSEENPLGLRDNQHRGGEHARAFYRRHYERARRWGFTRVVWHMPAGWVEEVGMPGSVAVLDAMGNRAREFLEEARAFLANTPGATVGVYISGQVPRHYLAQDPALAAEWEPYDHAKADHKSLVADRVIRPLVEAGFTEFWFDHTSGPEHREQALALFEDLRSRYGVRCVMEALPRNAEGGLDIDTMRRAPCGAIHRFMASLWQGDPWPAACEVNVILSAHTGVEPPAPADMERYLNAGAVLWSMNEKYDEAVAATIRRGPAPVTDR